MTEDKTTVEDVATEESTEEEDVFVFAENPTFDINYKGECAYEVKVSIPSANEAKQAQEFYEELRRDATVPGFRRGRVPMGILQKRFSKAVQQEVEAKLVNEAFQKLIKDEDLKPIDTPDIDGLDELKERKAAEPIEVTFSFEVGPRAELGKYRGLNVEKPVVTIADKDVDEQIQEMRERGATFVDLEGGIAAEGDQVIMSFKGTIDGEPFDGGAAEDYPYILGSQRFFPEFEKALVGTSPGDDISCAVTFPEDYFSEEMRGKLATFAISVSGVKRRTLPELDEAFAKRLGYESIEDLKAKVKKGLQKGSDGQSRAIVESRLIEQVVQESKFEIPKTLVNRIADSNYEEEVDRLRRARVSGSDIEAQEEQLRSLAQENALSTIKAIVAVNEIGDAEGIKVTEEDFDKEINQIAQRTGLDTSAVTGYIMGEQRNSYEDSIFRSKVLDMLIDSAKITEKEVTEDELSDSSGDEG